MIIGITGKARAGKDTLADQVLLASTYWDVGPATKYALADAVKQDCMTMGLTYDECHTNKTSTSRMIMQKYGTEVRRSEDPDYWIKRLFLTPRFIKDLCRYKHVFITDVRYLNEAEFIQKCGGIIWKVERPDHLREKIEYGEDHRSETEMERIIPLTVFINDDTKERLGDLALNELNNPIYGK